MKKSVAIILVVALLFCMAPTISVAAEKVTAAPTSSIITVDGAVMGFEAYLINQNNYFKLRDVAYALNGTDRQFEVTWDAQSKAINLITEEAYSVSGEEFQSANKGNITADKSSAQIFIDGLAAPMEAYTINGNNYFKLRDLGSYIGFGVGWDPKNSTVSISSNSDIAAESPQPTSTDTKKIDYHWEYPTGWREWDYSLEIPIAAYEAYKSVNRNQIYGYTEYISEDSDDEYLASLTQKFVDAAEENEFSDTDTVYLIITFVQALNYMSDLETTGYDEYPKYPLETLYDKGGDCEDMSILLASLLTELGYGAVLICFDDHMGVGIKGAEDLPGYYFEKYGIRYYYIETTSSGWEIGDMPEDYIDDQAQILFF